MGIEPIISSLQDWCLTTMALEALKYVYENILYHIHIYNINYF